MTRICKHDLENTELGTLIEELSRTMIVRNTAVQGMRPLAIEYAEDLKAEINRRVPQEKR